MAPMAMTGRRKSACAQPTRNLRMQVTCICIRRLGVAMPPHKICPPALVSHPPAAGAALLAFAVALLAAPPVARAEFKVRSPIVEFRECELEHNGSLSFDRRGTGLSNNQSYTNEIGCGITPFWQVELEAEFNAPPG